MGEVRFKTITVATSSSVTVPLDVFPGPNSHGVVDLSAFTDSSPATATVQVQRKLDNETAFHNVPSGKFDLTNSSSSAQSTIEIGSLQQMQFGISNYTSGTYTLTLAHGGPRIS